MGDLLRASAAPLKCIGWAWDRLRASGVVSTSLAGHRLSPCALGLDLASGVAVDFDGFSVLSSDLKSGRTTR